MPANPRSGQSHQQHHGMNSSDEVSASVATPHSSASTTITTSNATSFRPDDDALSNMTINASASTVSSSSATALAPALASPRQSPYTVFLQKPFIVVDQSEFICGWGAAFINITVTYPIYKIIFRQMLHGVNSGTAYQQLRAEGIAFLYRGIFPPLAQKTVSLSLMFGVYDGTRRPLVEAGVDALTAKTLAGLMAGTCEAALMPFERVQTLLADATYHKLFRNTAQAFRYVLAEHGMAELYRGLWPILIRNGPSNSMFFVAREEVAGRLPVHKNPVTQTAQEFFAGALIGAIISSIFYPLNVIKVAMQSTMGTPSMSIRQAFAHVYNERGRSVANVYKGVSWNCSRAFLSWGIMNTGYEHIKKLLGDADRPRVIAT